MDISLLGPLDVRLGPVAVAPTAGKPRRVLALLALAAGRTVPTDTLAEELWPDGPPRSAATTLQTYVLQLRALLADALVHAASPHQAKEVLWTCPGGYALDCVFDVDLDAGRTSGTGGSVHDVVEFERLGDEGDRARTAGEQATAALAYRGALSLWRGPALGDLVHGPVLTREVGRLEEARLRVVDARVELEFALGRHADVVGLLAEMCALRPTNERLCSQYMIALYRTGRRGDALAAFQRARAALDRELGLAPSPTLTGLQNAVLTATLKTERHAA